MASSPPALPTVLMQQPFVQRPKIDIWLGKQGDKEAMTHCVNA
jgi:hypothetical protein